MGLETHDDLLDRRPGLRAGGGVPGAAVSCPPLSVDLRREELLAAPRAAREHVDVGDRAEPRIDKTTVVRRGRTVGVREVGSSPVASRAVVGG